MRLKKLYILAVCFISAMPNAFANDLDTAFKAVAEVLTKYPKLYQFPEGDHYWGRDGATNRWNEVKARKVAYIQKHLIAPIEKKIAKMEELDPTWFEVKGHKFKQSTALECTKGIVIPAAKMGALYYMGAFDCTGTGEKAEKLAGLLLKERMLETGVGGVNTLLDTLNKVDTSLMDLETAIENIKYARDNDPCALDEERIIRGLGRMQPGMRKKVLDNLMNKRLARSTQSGRFDDHINYCLEFPQHTKSLPPGYDRDLHTYEGPRGEMQRFLNQMFTAPSPFANYSDATQEDLKMLVKAMCDRAKSAIDIEEEADDYTPPAVPEENRTPLRALLYGEPGTGKSYAAMKMAEKLGLPVAYYQIESREDMSASSQTGNSKYGMSNLGKLFRPFYIKDGDGKNWKNPVLIIDDVHLMFDKGSLKTHSFLNKLLDPNTKTIQCDYFGEEVEVDVSGMTIIMTANSDLGASAAKKAGPRVFTNAEDVMAPIRDRLLMIKFNDFPAEHKKPILAKFIDANHLMEYSLYNPKTALTAPAARDELITFIIEHFPYESPRKLCRIAERLANFKPVDWIKKSGLDPFIGMTAEEKQAALEAKLQESPMYKKIIQKKDADLGSSSARIARFILDYFPDISLKEMDRHAKKLASHLNKELPEWQRLLKVSAECIKLKELHDILGAGGNAVDWMTDYVLNSAFMNYYCHLQELEDADDRALEAGCFADLIIASVPANSLLEKMRKIALNDRDIWPCAAAPQAAAAHDDEDSDDSDYEEGVPQMHVPELNPETDLEEDQLSFWQEMGL
jgi:ATPase family protein associated with various cellular activities (AAA)